MFAFGFGTCQKDIKGVLDTFYPRSFANFQKPEALKDFLDIMIKECGYQGGNEVLQVENPEKLGIILKNAGHNGTAEQCELLTGAKNVCITILKTDEAPTTIEEVYLKLHLLSHRMKVPNSMNLDGMFGILTNIAWTSKGAVRASDVNEYLAIQRVLGKVVTVFSVDKFPAMLDYVVPSGIRITNGRNVRLGAYLSDGTTLMIAGACNFNAGTLGGAMIEGRISAGVIIGDGSDMGGGASTMGTLSGGGKEKISVGKNCLIGANAGIGISLGDRVKIESGLYLTAKTKVTVLNPDGSEKKVVKGFELSGCSDMTFRRNGESGRIEAVPSTTVVELNDELHKN